MRTATWILLTAVCTFTVSLLSAVEQKEKPALIDMKTGPVVLFEDACSRCHGPYGTFYGEEFAHLEPDELREVVWDMMAGPGGLDPSESEVNAMTEYHKALYHKKPYVSINNGLALQQGKTTLLQGDNSPDTEIFVKKGERTYPTEVKVHTWTIQNPPQPPFTVIAKRGEQQISFEFPSQQWAEIHSATEWAESSFEK
ncbi:MAG: hypothetical protein ACOX5R_03295 [bacterium]|jgi:cytochrome c553